MLTKLLHSTAQRRHDKPAVLYQAQETTYGQLLAKVEEIAERLTKSGVTVDDRVVLLLPNNPDFVAAFFAVARLGAVAVPINSLFHESELRFYFNDCRPTAVITTSELEPLCRTLGESLQLEYRVIVTDGEISGDPAPLPPDDEHRDEFTGRVLLQYSSGSTGTPKTIARTQADLVFEADAFGATASIDSGDRILTVVPLFHAHGFANCMLATVRAGAVMILQSGFNRQEVLTALKNEAVSVFPGVPFMFKMLAHSPGIEKGEFPSLRLAFSAGAPLDEATAALFPKKFGVPLRQLYGSTETGAVSINLGDCQGGSWASVGRPLRGIEIKIVDEQGRECPPGTEGELLVGSPGMTAGYVNSGSVGNQSFDDGFFRSGDLGRIDQSGDLYICGRKTLFINVSGNKVDPTEVEAVISDHPGVEEVVVVGVTDAGGSEIIKAVIVPVGDCTADQIRDWCYGKLVEYKIPRIVEFREEIPKSPLGKILRKYLEDTM